VAVEGHPLDDASADQLLDGGTVLGDRYVTHARQSGASSAATLSGMATVDGFRLDGVLLGVATAATQIEGGDVASSWTDWADRPGTIKDGSTPRRATDHWERWRGDTALMATLGVHVYRMSVEWARLEPHPGRWDDATFARYREELELLHDKGIRPLVTLHHFSHPSWFERDGGWLGPGALWAWERYVSEVVTRLGDLVCEWVTINEPNVYVAGAYVFGDFPPATVPFVRAYASTPSSPPRTCGRTPSSTRCSRARRPWWASPTTCAPSGRATHATRGTGRSRRSCATSSRT
jgi:hypothetical protein